MSREQVACLYHVLPPPPSPPKTGAARFSPRQVVPDGTFLARITGPPHVLDIPMPRILASEILGPPADGLERRGMAHEPHT